MEPSKRLPNSRKTTRPPIDPNGNEDSSCSDTSAGGEKSVVSKQRLERIKNDDNAPPGYIDPVYGVDTDDFLTPHFLI